MNYQDTPLAEIIVPENRLRELRDYSGLAASMDEVGLLQPVTVTDAGTLVAGRHRLEAARSLGWESIAAFVVEEDALANRLAEIDENLRRLDLTVYEQSKHAEERERVLEAMGQRSKLGQGRPSKNTATPAGFSEQKSTSDVAKEAGVSERSWQGRVKIGKGLGDKTRATLDHADPTDEKQRNFLNSTSQLNHLANISAKRGDEQAAQTAERVLGGEYKSTFDAYPEVREQRQSRESQKPEPTESMESTEPTEQTEPTIGELMEQAGVSIEDRPQRTEEQKAFHPTHLALLQLRKVDPEKLAAAYPELKHLEDMILEEEPTREWIDRFFRACKAEKREATKLRAVE